MTMNYDNSTYFQVATWVKGLDMDLDIYWREGVNQISNTYMSKIADWLNISLFYFFSHCKNPSVGK